MNKEFDDGACEELIHQAHTTSLTVTPSLWIRRTNAVGLHVKQGKGGGVSAYPEIAADLRLWLDPAERLALIRLVQEMKLAKRRHDMPGKKANAKVESTVGEIQKCGSKNQQMPSAVIGKYLKLQIFLDR